MLPASDEQDPYHVYQAQLVQTTCLAREMHREKVRLEALCKQGRPDVCRDLQDGELEKLKFISSQAAAAQQVVRLLSAHNAVLTTKDFAVAPSAEEQAARHRFYRNASHLLCTIDRSFRLALRVDARSFRPIFQHLHGMIEQYLLVVCGGGGAVLGSLVGAGAPGLSLPYGILHLGCSLGLHPCINSTFCLAGAVALGGAGGALLGLVLGMVLLELAELLRTLAGGADSPISERAELRKEIQRVLAAMEQELTADSIADFTSLFEGYFNAPLEQALTEDNVCPVCLEGFSANGSNSREQTTVAPSCVGNHVVHVQCQRAWVQRSGSEACVVCRQ